MRPHHGVLQVRGRRMATSLPAHPAFQVPLGQVSAVLRLVVVLLQTLHVLLLDLQQECWMGSTTQMPWEASFRSGLQVTCLHSPKWSNGNTPLSGAFG